MNHDDDLPVNEPNGACSGQEEKPFQPTSGINSMYSDGALSELFQRISKRGKLLTETNE